MNKALLAGVAVVSFGLVGFVVQARVAEKQRLENQAICDTLKPHFGEHLWVINSLHEADAREVRLNEGSNMTPEQLAPFTELVKKRREEILLTQEDDRKNFAGMPHFDRLLDVRQQLMRRYKDFPYYKTEWNTNGPIGLTIIHDPLEAVAKEQARNTGYAICMAG